MAEVSNDKLLETLMEIKEDLGGLKAGHTAIQAVLTGTHAAAAAAERRLVTLELAKAKQTGAFAVLGVVCSSIGAGVEVLVSYIWGKHP